MLEKIGGGSIGKETPDCGVTTVVDQPEIKLVTSLDFFYPSVDDPLLQGRIACCNVLSDLYAMGVTHVDQLLMVLGVSKQMSDLEQEVVTSLMVQGFDQTATEAGTVVTGGQTVYNPWPMIGGAAVAAIQKQQVIMPNQLREGDLLVLTKPLGTQLAVNAFQWLRNQSTQYSKIQPVISPAQIEQAFRQAVMSMATLNLAASRLMHTHSAHGATDVTGFGIRGHAQYLAQVQQQEVDLVIHSLPVIAGMSSIEGLARNFQLLQGYSAETSGGLLIAFTKQNAYNFQQELTQLGQQSWVIGEVVKGSRQAKFTNEVDLIQVDLERN